MTAMAGAIIAPALPGISAHFPEQPDVLIKLILTMPALSITLFGPIAGFLADRLGRKPIFLASLLIYGVSGFSGFLIDQLSLLIASRAMLGIGVGGILSISTAMIGDYFPASERSWFLGMQSAFMAIGGILFLNLGGALVDWSWRGPFLVYLTGIILLPYAWVTLSKARRIPSTTPDRQKSNTISSSGHSYTILAYGIGLICMMLFYFVPVQLPFLLQEHAKIGGLAMGMALSATPIGSAATSLTYHRIQPHISVIMLYAIALLAISAGFTVIGLTNSHLGATLGAAISGIGFGWLLPNTTTWLMDRTPEHIRGRVFGGFSSAFFFGQFISPLVVAFLLLWVPSLQSVYLVAATLCTLVSIPLILSARSRLSRKR